MKRLQKFVERRPFGEGPGGAAYVRDLTKLHDQSIGFEWRAVHDFMPSEAILADPGLKAVFKSALSRCGAVVARTLDA